LEGLPHDVTAALRDRFDGCEIHVQMQRQVRPADWQSAAARLAEFLLTLDPAAQGTIARGHVAHLAVRPLSIYRSKSSFHPNVVMQGAGAWVNVQFSPTLKNKLDKNYPAEHHPVELLIYTAGLTPNAPDWKEDARAVMEQRIEDSGFRCIWLHDDTSQTVVKVARAR
jgi:hypothetical protein